MNAEDASKDTCLRCQVHDGTRGWSERDLAELRDIVRAVNQLKPLRRQCWDLWAFLAEVIIPEVESGKLKKALGAEG